MNTSLINSISDFIFRGIPVSTVAEAMAIDAYQYKTSQTQSEPSGNNVTVMTNADIHRTVQVRLKTVFVCHNFATFLHRRMLHGIMQQINSNQN